MSVGYEKVDWSSTVESVQVKYPRGQINRLAGEVIYRQFKPSKQISRRNFAFKKGFLRTVSVTFDKQYVVNQGIEKLFQGFIEKYGEGVMDGSQAPYMISYMWHGRDTKVTFSYAPKRPDMTVILYEYADNIESAGEN